MVLLPGVIPRPIVLSGASGQGAPTIRVRGIDPEREGRFSLEASYLYFFDRLVGEDEYRIFFLTLAGEIGLMSEAILPAAVEEFQNLLHEYSGWFCLELELPERLLRFSCDGYLDFTGAFPAAVAALNGGDRDEALCALRDVLARVPRLKYARVLVHLLERGSASPDALGHLKEAAALFPWDPGILSLLGDALLEGGHPRRAAVFYHRALQLSPCHEAILQRLLECVRRDGQLRIPGEWLQRLARMNRKPELRRELESLGVTATPFPAELVGAIRQAERAARKGAYGEAMLQVVHCLEVSPADELTPIRRWAAELISCIPERLPPFVMPGLVGDLLRLLRRINPDRDPVFDLHLARFIDAVVSRFGIGMGQDDRERLFALHEEMHRRHEDRAEFAAYPVRTLIHLAEDAVARGELAEAESLWQRLRGFIDRDPCRPISSYTAISLLTRQLDELYACPCRGDGWRQRVIGRVWNLLRDLIDETTAFAHFTPLLLLVKRWHGRPDGEPEAVTRMISDLQRIREKADGETAAMFRRTVEVTGTEGLFA